MAAREEKRRNVRVRFKTSAVLEPLEAGGLGPVVVERTRDLSLKGIYCETPIHWPPGTKAKITLRLTGTSSELSIRMKGHVVRSDEGGMALLFDETDLESLYHLKNILYYNTGDPERIDRELLEGTLEGWEPGGGTAA